jgi:hypothetical protein
LPFFVTIVANYVLKDNGILILEIGNSKAETYIGPKMYYLGFLGLTGFLTALGFLVLA